MKYTNEEYWYADDKLSTHRVSVRNVHGIEMCIRPNAAFEFINGMHYKAPHNKLAMQLCRDWNAIKGKHPYVNTELFAHVKYNTEPVDERTGRQIVINTIDADIPKVWIPVHFINPDSLEFGVRSDIANYRELTEKLFEDFPLNEDGTNLVDANEITQLLLTQNHLYQYLPLSILEKHQDGHIVELPLWDLFTFNVRICQQKYQHNNFEDAINYTMW